MRARLREPARTRAVGSLGLCLLLLLAGPARLAAQDVAAHFFPAVDRVMPEHSSARSSPAYRLVSEESRDHDPWMALETPFTLADTLSLRTASWTQACPTPLPLSADADECEWLVAPTGLTIDAPQPDAEVPKLAFLERHRQIISILIPIAGLALVTANSLIGYDTDHGFQIHNEGWFGPNTTNGGADKASHFADYFVVASLFEDFYKMLGYSEKAAILWGFGLAVATGLANEVSDGFTRHGFSWEDLVMDTAGAATASAISATHTRDLLGVRTSHLPGSTYTHDVYSADFKLSGLGRRLGVNLGPLRWLLLSVTYGSKGYRVTPPINLQRQVGFEVGLNLQQILFDLDVKRSTWWGYPIHAFADNVRLPFTAVGMRVDLNRGKWHGPNSGNYD